MNSIDEIDKMECYGCGVCKIICPVQAITMEYVDGFMEPVVSKERCINCGRCMQLCPTTEKLNPKKITEANIAICKDDEVYQKSSSGGVFGVLAHYFIKKMNGIVCGVKMTDELIAKHVIIDNENDIHYIQGSKYVQSEMWDVLPQISKYLLAGRNVLFSGTPCQIAALKGYLQNDYENLFCIDLVCHGVPSPELFTKHIFQNVLSKEEKIEEVKFRTKDQYDRYGYNLKIKTNKRTKLIAGTIDPYFRCFLKSMSLRESCYKCRFANDIRIGDITVSDCGNSKYYKDFYPNKTISTVYPITDKGKELWKNVSKYFEWRKVDENLEISANKPLNRTTMRPEGREKFYSCDASELPCKANALCGKITFLHRCKVILKRVVPEEDRKKILSRGRNLILKLRGEKNG